MKTLPFRLNVLREAFRPGMILLATLLFAAPVDGAKKPDEGTSLLPPATRMTPARTETRHIYTNDDLAPSNASVVEATIPTEPAQATVPAERGIEEPPEVALSRIRRRAEKVLEQGLETLNFRERQLDVSERDFTLQRTQFYSDPNFSARERTGDYGGLEALGQQVEQQRSGIAALQNSLVAVADLVEDLRLEDATKISQEEAATRRTPEYWQDQLARLRAKLEATEAEMANFRYQRETGRTGIVLGMGNSFLNTYDYVNQLEQRVESLRRAMAGVEDQAFQENIPPGWLR